MSVSTMQRKTTTRWAARVCLLAMLALPLMAPSQASAAPEGELVVAQPSLFTRYDPLNMVSTTDHQSYNMLFDGLINTSPEGKVPALATSWKVSADGLTIDFVLRKGVKFHNGDPFTAEDVHFTFMSIAKGDNKHSYRKSFQTSLKDVEIVDDFHVRFHLNNPWPTFFSSSRQGIQSIVPKKYYQSVGSDGFIRKPVGTGPFKLDRVSAGEFSRFEANADYWGVVSDARYVVKRLAAEPLTRYAMLVRGEADIIQGVTGPLLEKVKTNDKLRIITADASGTNGLYFNIKTNPEFKDRRVRMAVAHAMDREGINKVILSNTCEVATSIFSPATFGYLDGLKPIPYDPEKAKSLLREAGIKEGHEIGFVAHTQSFGSLPNAPRVLEAIAGNLEAVGFKVNRVPVDTGAFLKMYRGGQQATVFYGPSSAADDGGETINGWYLPDSVWSSGNVDDPDYVTLYHKQLVEADSDKRKAMLQEWARMEDERRRALPLFWCNTPFAVGPRVAEWKPALGTPYSLELHRVRLKR